MSCAGYEVATWKLVCFYFLLAVFMSVLVLHHGHLLHRLRPSALGSRTLPQDRGPFQRLGRNSQEPVFSIQAGQEHDAAVDVSSSLSWQEDFRTRHLKETLATATAPVGC